MPNRRRPGEWAGGCGFGYRSDRSGLALPLPWPFDARAFSAGSGGHWRASRGIGARPRPGSPASDRGERREALDGLADRSPGDLVFQRAVLVADDRVALVAELVEVPVVGPHVLSELELADQAPADHEGRDPALPAVLRLALGQVRPVGRPASDQAATFHVRGRVPRVHAADVGPEGHGVAEGVGHLVIEVVVAPRVGPEARVGPRRRQDERGPAPPPAHELGGEEFLLLGRPAIRAEEVAEGADVLLQAAVGGVGAVAAEGFRIGLAGDVAVLVGVAEEELARLQRAARAGRRLVARA